MTKSNEQIAVWRSEIAAIQAKIDANTPKPEKHPELADCMKVGNKLWLIPNWVNDGTGYEVEVLSVGRKWVRLSKNLKCEKSGINARGTLYPSQRAREDLCDLSNAWHKLARKFEWGRMPKNVSMADIRDICEKLGFNDVTKREK